jgi:hypothetical protein
MPETDPGGAPSPRALAAVAFRYARGEADGPEAAAFERRLAADQSAREALCRAVTLARSLAGLGPPRPDPAYRERVRQRLRPPHRAGRD